MYRLDYCGDYILLTAYVDDLLYTGTSNDLLAQFEKSLSNRIEITSTDHIIQFLGLIICYAADAIHLSTAKYTETLYAKFNIKPANISTPYRSQATPDNPNTSPLNPTGHHQYQQQLGCLLFTEVTCRPDLSYISSQLALYAKRAEAEHMLDLQRALQYFISTPHIGLTYSTLTSRSFSLFGYVNADHAAGHANRWSRTGFLFRLEPIGPFPRIPRSKKWWRSPPLKQSSSLPRLMSSLTEAPILLAVLVVSRRSGARGWSPSDAAAPVARGSVAPAARLSHGASYSCSPEVRLRKYRWPPPCCAPTYYLRHSAAARPTARRPAGRHPAARVLPYCPRTALLVAAPPGCTPPSCPRHPAACAPPCWQPHRPALLARRSSLAMRRLALPCALP
ncbi:unnamed protein product [Closterium sp. NIES-54]